MLQELLPTVATTAVFAADFQTAHQATLGDLVLSHSVTLRLRCAAYYQQQLLSHSTRVHSERRECGTTLEQSQIPNLTVLALRPTPLQALVLYF